MGRKILAVIVGLVVGGLVVYVMEALGHALYPLPEGLNPKDAEALKEYLPIMPLGALLMVAFAHGLGSLAGGAATTLMAGRSSPWPGVIVGAVLLLGGIMNVVMIPHPLWFALLDLAIYLPAAYLGAWLALKRPPSAAAASPGTSP